jgi:predicted ATPase with chaperone activity
MDEFFGRVLSHEADFGNVRGQEIATRALVAAANGGQELLTL